MSMTQEEEELVVNSTKPSGVEIGGRVYNTVRIGNLEWMSENLAWESGSFKYPNNIVGNADEWGLLYTHPDALSLAPEGWRLPTQGDFDALLVDVGGIPTASKELKADDDNQWPNTTTRGSDPFRFSAQSAGFCFASSSTKGDFKSIGHYWSSSSGGASTTWVLDVRNSYNSTAYSNASTSAYQYSVRYVKDI